jgi:hypothetical protein
LEQDKIKLPMDQGLIDELDGFHYKYNEQNRKVKMESPLNDDRVMSLALAVWDIPNHPVSYHKEEARELLKQFDSHRRKSWEATVRK